MLAKFVKKDKTIFLFYHQLIYVQRFFESVKSIFAIGKVSRNVLILHFLSLHLVAKHLVELSQNSGIDYHQVNHLPDHCNWKACWGSSQSKFEVAQQIFFFLLLFF